MMKVCVTIELKTPTAANIKTIINLLMPKLDFACSTLNTNIFKYIGGDLRKINSVYEIYKNQQSILKNKIIANLFQPKTNNEDTKNITKKLLNNKYDIKDHNILMNETDRTSVGLLFHENIIDVLQKIDNKESIPFYLEIFKKHYFCGLY